MPDGQGQDGGAPAPDGGAPSSGGRFRRRRDRHGRGVRGPLAPPALPFVRTRAEAFDDLVLDAVERLQRHLPDVARIEVGVDDVPAAPSGDPAGPPIPLGRSVDASGDRPARIIVHRRPVELRANGTTELTAIVQDVVAEQVAVVLGLTRTGRPDLRRPRRRALTVGAAVPGVRPAATPSPSRP